VTGDPSWYSAVVLAFALAACSKARAPGAGPSAADSAVGVIAAPSGADGHGLATPTAFDLVPSASGATLSFVEAAPRRIVRLELDANGVARGGPVLALDADAMAGEPSDLASSRVGGRLAVAWVEREGPKARVRAAWAQAEGLNAAAPTKVLELGSAWAAPRTARGNLVVAVRGDRALVFARGEQAACVDPDQRTCFGFSFHELAADRAIPTGLPLTVPVPCMDHSAMLAVVGGRWHYGVCTDTGTSPMTTVFTIERNPEYGRADRLLQGCRPRGAVVFGGAAWLVGDCQGSRRAVRVAGREVPLYFL
jgi:hypothetical protein